MSDEPRAPRAPGGPGNPWNPKHHYAVKASERIVFTGTHLQDHTSTLAEHMVFLVKHSEDLQRLCDEAESALSTGKQVLTEAQTIRDNIQNIRDAVHYSSAPPAALQPMLRDIKKLEKDPRATDFEFLGTSAAASAFTEQDEKYVRKIIDFPESLQHIHTIVSQYPDRFAGLAAKTSELQREWKESLQPGYTMRLIAEGSAPPDNSIKR